MRRDSYVHYVAHPYKALKCKIQQNRFIYTIALITLPRRTFMGPKKSDVIPGALEESKSLNPPLIANMGIHSLESVTTTTHKNVYWRRNG